MSVIDQFSSSCGRRDQGPNRALAARIVDRDHQLLGEVMDATSHQTTALGNDAVMVLMAVGELHPELLVPYTSQLLDLLSAKSNRQVWGSMIALSHIAPLIKSELLEALPLILGSMDSGSIVGRDHGYTILTVLYEDDSGGILWPLMKEQLLKCPPNQFGQYTEKTMEVLKAPDREEMVFTIEQRLSELTNEHHRKRALKNLKTLHI